MCKQPRTLDATPCHASTLPHVHHPFGTSTPSGNCRALMPFDLQRKAPANFQCTCPTSESMQRFRLIHTERAHTHTHFPMDPLALVLAHKTATVLSPATVQPIFNRHFSRLGQVSIECRREPTSEFLATKAVNRYGHFHIVVLLSNKQFKMCEKSLKGTQLKRSHVQMNFK